MKLVIKYHSLPQLLSPKPSHPHQAHHSSFLLSLPIATPAAFHGLVDATAASYFLTVVVPCLVAVILFVLCSTLIASNLPLLMSNLGV
ncbi:hypothetical protein HN51_036089 [Arachis hypogaea]